MHEFLSENEIVEILESRGIKATAIRIMLLRVMASEGHAMSVQSLEDELETFDKSTIFRAITLFNEHGLLHSIDDGTGVVKYAFCHDDHEEEHQDLHVHFYCESCHKTLCLEDVPAPHVDLPEGFVQHGVNFVVKGLCPDCSSRR